MEVIKSIKGRKINQEHAADLVGDYIFSDAEFVNSLVSGNRNIFEKIYDEVKYLCKTVTAGSKEARQLEKVKKIFADAYRQDVKNTAGDGGVRYSLSKDIDGNTFVDIKDNIFDPSSGESVDRTIQKVISERFHNKIDVHGQTIQINKTTNDEFRNSESARTLAKQNGQAYNDKLRTIANADEILVAARSWIGEATKHIRKDDIVEFARADVAYRVDGRGYVADVLVGTRKNGAAVLYDLVNIYEKEITEAPVTMVSNDGSQRRQDTSVKMGSSVKSDTAPTEISLPQNSEKSMETGKKADFSLSDTSTKPFDNGVALETPQLVKPAAENAIHN